MLYEVFCLPCSCFSSPCLPVAAFAKQPTGARDFARGEDKSSPYKIFDFVDSLAAKAGERKGRRSNNCNQINIRKNSHLNKN